LHDDAFDGTGGRSRQRARITEGSCVAAINDEEDVEANDMTDMDVMLPTPQVVAGG
jgi:hypothetical protein